MTLTHYDICVVGGGILGVGIAADAASRGLSVCLFEKDDFAQGTSSRSSSLIHGGLRYLEHYEFGLVREALREQTCLMQRAPHLVHPLPFYLPMTPNGRSPWLIKLGLTLYDWLSNRPLPKSRSVTLAQLEPGCPLEDTYSKAFEYHDCQTDDSQLVMANALYARSKGADLFNYHRVTDTQQHNDYWHVSVNDEPAPRVSARLLVKAIGPWGKKDDSMRLVKGSHFVVNQQYPGHYGFYLPLPDGRLFFVTPYQQKWTMVGTTEEAYHGNLETITMSPDERQYLIGNYNHYFKLNITEEDICHEWSGVRALLAESNTIASKTSREHVITLDQAANEPAMMNIYGGKLTTYRSIAEDAVDKCKSLFDNLADSTTAADPLPGSNTLSQTQWPWLPKHLFEQMVFHHGGLVANIIEDCHCLDDLGAEIVPGLYEKELHYLMQQQWAKTAEDIVWRRTKRGLGLSDNHRQTLSRYLQH